MYRGREARGEATCCDRRMTHERLEAEARKESTGKLKGVKKMAFFAVINQR